MRNMKFVKRIGVAVLAACMVLSCVGCGSSSNKGAAEGTTEIAAEGGQTKISVAAAASLQATFDDELIPLFEKENQYVVCAGEDIVWLVNERTDNRFRVTEHTRQVWVQNHCQRCKLCTKAFYSVPVDASV